MKITADRVTRTVLADAGGVLDECMKKIRHCLDQLSDEQVWWRPREEMNSIGNLLLHLRGNIRQWIVAGLGHVEDDRDRAAEFSHAGPIPTSELMAQLANVVSDAKTVLAQRTPPEMLANCRIQGFELTGWKALFDSIPHFKGHTQEIICLTRMQLGTDYQFEWQPQTSEEGAEA